MEYKYPTNTILYTKDGRAFGNAIVVGHRGNKNIIRTDYGNDVGLNDDEIPHYFYLNLTEDEKDMSEDWAMLHDDMAKRHKHYVEPPRDGHFFVKCNVCEQVLEDWVGSTPCCGAIAYGCDSDGNELSSDAYNEGLFSNNNK